MNRAEFFSKSILQKGNTAQLKIASIISAPPLCGMPYLDPTKKRSASRKETMITHN